MSFEIILDQVIKTSPFLIDPESKKTSVQRFQSSAAPCSSEILHDEISFFYDSTFHFTATNIQDGLLEIHLKTV